MSDLKKSEAEKIEGLISKAFITLLWNILGSIYKILLLPIHLISMVCLIAVSIISIPALLQAKVPRWLKK